MNINIIRQIVLDTETTGLNKLGIHYEGHKIIEIGAVEIINRRLTKNQFHVYLNPNRSVDTEAFRIHGISDQFLINQPTFSEIANDFIAFINGCELIIHNAAFDIGFLNYELKNSNLNFKQIASYCTVIDSLKLARKMFPGQRNSLDALCERYCIDNKKRILHNALIDAQLLAHVFLSMTGGQTKIQFLRTDNINTTSSIMNHMKQSTNTHVFNVDSTKPPLKVVFADHLEQSNHDKYLDWLDQFSKSCLWKQLD